MSAPTETPIGEQVIEAIAQLKKSERGRSAAVAFRSLIANGGGGSAAYAIKDALPSR